MPRTLTREAAKVSPSTVQPDTDTAAIVVDAPRRNGHGPKVAEAPPQTGSDGRWEVYRQALDSLAESVVAPAPTLPTGPAMAAILGAGFGAAGLGLLVTAEGTIDALSKALIFNRAVGPLSGKTTVAVAIWLVAWAVLHLLWRNRDVDARRVTVATTALLVVGLLGTFPPVFDAVAHFFGA